MAKPLLPRYKPGTKTPTRFSAADSKSGVSKIVANDAQDDLIWAQGLRSEGVSHCLAGAEVFRWRLALGKAVDPYARGVVEFLLQCQFLGQIEFHHVSLTEPPSLLKRVIRDAAGVPEIVLWRLNCESGADPVLVGARFGTRYPLFPSAAFQDDAVKLRELALKVEASSGGAVRFHDNRLDFVDEAAARRFRGEIAALAASTSSADRESPWHSVFAEIAGGEAPSLDMLAPDGLIAPDTARDRWICPAHASAGRSWIDDARGQTITVTAEDPFIRCPAHDASVENNIIRDAHNVPITVETLGGAVVRTPGGPRLFVWEDETRPAHLIKVPSTGGGVTFAYWDKRGPRIRLEGVMVRLANVLTPSIALPAGPSGATASLGVAPQHLELLAARDWDRVRKTWRVQFKGRREPTLLPQPDPLHADPKDGVVVWPPVVVVDEKDQAVWQADLVGLSFGPYCTEAAEVVRRSDGALVERPYRKKPWLGANQDRVEYVALQRDRQPVGVVPLERPRVEVVRTRAGFIAIDFGTSNTTVMYKAAGDAEAHFVSQGVPDPSKTVFPAVAGPESEEQLRSGLILFSSWFRQQEPTRLFGSLLVELAKGDRGVAILPRHSSLLKNFKRDGDSFLHDDLKWQDPRHARTNALELYLERALIAAVYELVRRGCASVRVAATYPLAFDNARLQLYQGALKQVLARIEKTAGVRVEPLRLFSESAAGIRATAGEGADATLTIDLGGGTTDIAVVVNDQVVAVDSLKIGARGLLSTVLAQGRNASDAVISTLELQNLDVSRAVAIEAALQEQPSRVRLVMGPVLAAAAVKQAIAASFAAVIVAAVRLVKLAAGTAHPTVNVVLLGQGWQLLHEGILGPFNEEWFLSNLTRHAASFCDMRRTNPPKDFQERKLFLARGAMKLVEHEPAEEKTYYDPPILLGMDLRAQGGQILPGNTRVQGVRVGKITDDGGFDQVIDELWRVMKGLSMGPGHELGLDDAQLNEPSAPGDSLRLRLRREAVHLLAGDLSPGGVLLESPLMRFLDQCWQGHWAATDVERT